MLESIDIKKYLELGDLFFLKYRDSQIKIKDHFQLIRGKTPPTDNPEYCENGDIKWINSGVLTNLYFLTEYTEASKLVTEKAAQECQLSYAQPNTVLISIIRISEFDKVAWVQKSDFALGTGICNFIDKQGSQKEKNATLFFALRSLDLSSYSVGSMFPSIQTSVLMNMKINWVSNPAHQKIFFTILNSKLSQIKDLHRKIKDLLLLKYFGKK